MPKRRLSLAFIGTATALSIFILTFVYTSVDLALKAAFDSIYGPNGKLAQLSRLSEPEKPDPESLKQSTLPTVLTRPLEKHPQPRSN
jgi:hypothetical protein